MKRLIAMMALCFFISPGLNRMAQAHCDSLDGPIAKEAEAAFSKGDPGRLLKWVAQDGEAELKEAFAKALAVQGKGKAAQDLGKRWFLETLVRLHRASEGAAFTGLKPAGSVDPALLEADKALELGSAESLAKELGAQVSAALLERFEKAKAARLEADKDAAAGRNYVRAYVEFLHFVEDTRASLEGSHGHSAGHEGHKE